MAYIILIYFELQGNGRFKNMLLLFIFKNKIDIDVHATFSSLKNHETFFYEIRMYFIIIVSIPFCGEMHYNFQPQQYQRYL